MHEITYSALHTWAAQQPNDQAIGLANSCGLCPVAMYLAATTGEPWEVTPLLNSDLLYARHFVSGETIALPVWLSNVIYDVDRIGRGRPPVGKARFLAILADHKPGEATQP